VDPVRVTWTESSVTEQCRRLGELLGFDAVGVAAEVEGRLRVAWWSAPDAPAFPPRLDDVLEGRAPGWIVRAPTPGANVFARTTTHTRPRAAAVLESLGPSLLEAALVEEAPAGHGPARSDRPDPGLDDSEHRVGAEPAGSPWGGLRKVVGGLVDVGCDTVSMFAPSGEGDWQLVERVGPERPWHAVLDPGTLGPGAEGSGFEDAAAIPGVGPRLAALGCGSLAVAVLPGGGRAILDSARRGDDARWVRAAGPFLSLLRAVANESVAPVDPGMLGRIAEACRRALETPGTTSRALLEAVAGSVGATEAFFLAERRGELAVIAASPGTWPRRVPPEVRAGLASLPRDEPIDDARSRQLGVLLGTSGPVVGAAFAGSRGPMELLVTSWAGGSTPPTPLLGAAAQMVGGTIAAIESRGRAVEEQLHRVRERWADVIHDGLTQAVTTAVLELEAITKRIEEDPRQAIDALERTRQEIRGSLEDLRGWLFTLSQDRPPGPMGDEPFVRSVEDVAQRWRLPADLQVRGSVEGVPASVLGAAYIVIREALTNAAKHAGASKVKVRVDREPDALTVEVRDAGRGFSPSTARAARAGGHLGLAMMERRVAEAGGTLEVRSVPGSGTRVVARLPLPVQGGP
jgi:signal transduction histidine kinase